MGRVHPAGDWEPLIHPFILFNKLSSRAFLVSGTMLGAEHTVMSKTDIVPASTLEHTVSWERQT